ncbi:MAG: HlyD family secretion protein [Rhodanobacteraceae bacterium]
MTERQENPAVADPAEPAAKPRRRKIVNRILWIAGPALVLAVAGYFYLLSGRFASTDNAYVGADQVTIAPQVAGRVVEVDVRENQAVKKGDVLFRIDPEPLEIAVAQMRAQLGAIGDYLAASRDSYHSAVADLASAQSTLKNDKRQLARMKQLRQKGVVPEKMLDDAVNDVGVARGDRDSKAAAVAKAKTLLGGSATTAREDLPGYKVALAQLAKAELDLQHAIVRAPIDGVIGKTMLQPGDFLNVGQAAMPLVANQVYVDANFKETDLTHVKVGQPASVDVDTYPDHNWKAHVVSISPASGGQFSILPAQNATGNWVKIVQRIPVRLALDEADSDGHILRAGMSAEVEIDTGRRNSPLGRLLGDGDSTRQVALGR